MLGLAFAAFGVFEVDPSYSVRYLERNALIENVDLVAGGIAQAFDPQRRVGLGIVGAVGFWLLATGGWRRLRFDGGLPALWGLFGVWACASVAWSDDPTLTARRLAVLGLLAVGAAGVATCCSLEDVARVGFVGGLFIITAGLGCEVALKTFHPEEGGYRFAGVMNPIGTAIAASIVLLSVPLLLRTVRRQRTALFGGATLGLVLMLLTRSRGPVVAFVLGYVSYAVLTWTARWKIGVAGILVVVASMGVMVHANRILDIGPEIVLLGRDSSEIETLTGRVPLWQYVAQYVNERPVLGFGYNSFWTPTRFTAVARATGFNVADVHSSYLGLLLGLGYPGAVLGCGLLVGAMIGAWAKWRRTGEAGFAFALAVLMAHAVNGLLLSVFLSEDFSSFVAMVVMIHVSVVRPVALEAVSSLGEAGGRGGGSR